MSSIGHLFREARNKKSITFEEAHSRTKIHPRVLQLLEEDKFDKLPSPMFVKSFLKTYAEFLEMNPEEIVRAYESEGVEPPAQTIYIRPAAERDKKTLIPFDKSLLVIPALVLALLAGGGSIYFLMKKAAHHPWKDKKILNIIKPSKAKSAKAEAKPAKPEVLDGFNASDWLRHPALNNFPKIGKKEPLHLKIKAADAVWLRVTSDGKVLFQSILKTGVTETWTASDHFELWTGNASNMALTLNNYDLGSPGKGVMKKMAINRQGVRAVTG